MSELRLIDCERSAWTKRGYSGVSVVKTLKDEYLHGMGGCIRVPVSIIERDFHGMGFHSMDRLSMYERLADACAHYFDSRGSGSEGDVLVALYELIDAGMVPGFEPYGGEG